MAEDITVHFTPIPQDYVKTYRFLQVHSTFSRISYGVMVIFELCLIASVLIPGSQARLWPVAVGIPIFMVLAILLPGYSVGRRAKGSEQWRAETTWELNDSQLRVSNQFVDAKYEWGFFQGLVENKEYFYLRHSSNKRLYNFIPKRAFASADQIQEFREAFQKHTAAGQGRAAPSAAKSE